MKIYTLNLDRERELQFGFKAIREIRNKLGERSVESLLSLKWDEVPILIWAGLKKDDKQLTLEKVESLLDDAVPAKYTIIQITNLVVEAFSEHMGLNLGKKDSADDQEESKKTTAKKQPKETIPSTKKQKK